MGIKKSNALMMMSLAMISASMAQGNLNIMNVNNYDSANRKRQPKPIEPPIQSGMKYYYFREDGTFKQYERDGAMLKDEVVFKCYALNDKNAIKKFNKFKTE
jgi:hypothetical protein